MLLNFVNRQMESNNEISIPTKLEMDDKYEPMLLKRCMEFMRKKKAIKEFVTISTLIIIIIILVVLIIFTR